MFFSDLITMPRGPVRNIPITGVPPWSFPKLLARQKGSAMVDGADVRRQTQIADERLTKRLTTIAPEQIQMHGVDVT